MENSRIASILNHDMKPILKRIYYFIENHWRIFLNILAQPDIFTAAEDILRLINLSSDTLYLKEKELSPLPLVLEEFWMPILVLIHQKDKIPHFLENLLIAQENCKIPICQKTAIAWAIQIILGPSPTSPLGTCFQKKGLLLDFRKLLYACLKGNNQYSFNLCKVIVEELGNKKKYSHLFTIMALKNGMCVPEEHNSQSKSTKEIIFTIDDVLEDLNEIKRQEKPNTCKDNIWSVAPVHMDFSNIPLGAVLSQNSEMEVEEPEENKIDIETSDENFIVNNENDDEGTIEVTVDTNLPASFHPEQFGMLYT
ncbi:ribosomal biogenesis protein LAS1L [Trichonephila inaurata madagascariensis]|uniref:Ribosomal biogenesis protein LAS1L n=1 Tax=Trichonephila inaurata madagascariensis TaxID=2747483 RepID=A0A8X6XLL3_9ARAC|nr:ribosomal biogenesis protein LAS1L [Trichonephila inaurata madagascariensis]